MVLAAFAAAASAEAIEIRTGQQPTLPAAPAGAEVRVSVGVNVFVPSPSDDGGQALKAQETGRKIIYDLAGHECAVLRDSIASDCRLESVNVNIQRVNQFGNQQRPDGFNVNGNISFRIVPK